MVAILSQSQYVKNGNEKNIGIYWTLYWYQLVLWFFAVGYFNIFAYNFSCYFF